MKKFLKRAVAVLLTVCLAASFVVPVSALTITGTQTSTEEVTNNYKTVNGGKTTASGTLFTSDAYDAYSNREMTYYSGSGGYILTKITSTSRYLALKLKNIGTAVDGKYDITLNLRTGDTTAANIYLFSGDKEITSVNTEFANATPLSQQVTNTSATLKIEDVELGNYLSDGSFYIVFRGTGSSSKVALYSIDVTYTEEKTITGGVIYEGPAATASAQYDFYDSTFEDTQNVLATEGMYKVLNDAYAKEESNWAPVAAKYSSSNYPMINADVSALQIRSLYQDWFALKIKSPGAGSYQIDLDYYGNSRSTRKGTFYIMEYKDSYADMDDAVSLISNAITNDDCEYKVADQSFRKGTAADGTMDLGSYTFEANKEYLVVFYASGSRYTTDSAPDDTSGDAYMFIQSLKLTADLMEYEDVDAGKFSAFNVVKLAYNYEGSINVDGYTLDLNGKTVNGSVVATSGNVIDSTDGSAQITGTAMISGDNAGYIPLKDGTVTRLFNSTSTVTFDSANPYVQGEYVLYWFDITFTNSAAYSLIASGNSGLKISAAIAVNGEKVADVTFDKTVKSWAAADHALANQAMGAAISNVAAAGEGAEIEVAFQYESAGAVYQIGSLSYTVPTAE